MRGMRVTGKGAMVLAAAAACAVCACGGTVTSTTVAPATPPSGEIVPMGMRVDTTKGYVIVHTYEPLPTPTTGVTPAPGDSFGAADIEACAGPNADASTGVSTVRFHLQIGKFTVRATTSVMKPALTDTVLAPNHCVRGWLTFEIPAGSKPAYVIFQTTKVIGWQIT